MRFALAWVLLACACRLHALPPRCPTAMQLPTGVDDRGPLRRGPRHPAAVPPCSGAGHDARGRPDRDAYARRPAYLAHDGRAAVVVDPQRDIDRVLGLLADARGVRITHVVETHIHNDYVTGGRALAAAGASYLRQPGGPGPVRRVSRSAARVGDQVSPSLGLRAVATPGHTSRHLSYALSLWAGDRGRACSPAGRCCSAPPVGPTCSVRTQRRFWCAPSTPRRAGSRPSAGRRRAVPDPRLRQLLLGHADRTRRRPRSGTSGRSTGADPGRAAVRGGPRRAWTPSPPTTPAWPQPTLPAPGRCGPVVATSGRGGRAEATDRRRRVGRRPARAGAFAAGHAPGTVNVGLDGSSPPTWAG